jgi:acyl-[acyl-carrier-protein]-phospholipid O-acyltransferase / long-chain-fatty-acid--[acyl-carrier-protein] ligase
VTKAASQPVQKNVTGRFTAMAACYFLGTFNDNFFKQAVMLLAVSSGRVEFQGYALNAFTLPFIVIAFAAGWLADRFAKKNIVIAAKWIELLAMCFGAVGIVTGNWILIFAMLVTMGSQSTIFSPAINGSIPELFPESGVVRANGIFRMTVMTAILLGSGLSGFVVDLKGAPVWGIEFGKFVFACVILGIAVLGVAAGYFVYSKKAAFPQKPFPWRGPIDTIKVLFSIRKDRLLVSVIALDVFIWFAGSVEVLLINPMGVNQFGFSKTKTSLMIVAQLVGIGAGGLLSSLFAKGPRWYRILIPAGFGMALFMGLVYCTPFVPASLKMPLVYAAIGAVGLFGGLFMIPLESFIQIRPRAEDKGTIWASANFVIFTGIFLSAYFANFLNKHVEPTQGFAVMGIISLVVSVFLFFFFRKGKLA